MTAELIQTAVWAVGDTVRQHTQDARYRKVPAKRITEQQHHEPTT